MIDEDEYDNYIAYSDTVTITNGNETVKPVTNITRKGGITIYKQDAVSGNAAQGDGKLAGAEFEIINKSGKTINYNGAKFDDGASLGTIATDENGVATTGELAISTGTYLIREFSAPEGYLVNSGWEKTITLTEQGEMYTLDADEACKDTIISGGVKLQKLDDENGTKQGDASLEGAEFSIINKSANPVYVNGKSYAQGEVVMTITTDENGIASSGEKVLPYGKYEIAEIKPPVGYKISNQVISFSITKDGEMVELMSENKAVKETVIRGGISVQKYDAERMESAAANTNASLSGANIQIVNKSAAPIVFNGKEIGVNEVVTTIVTDENGFASTEANALPYGTYELTETKAPNGYLVNKDWKVTVKICDNTIVAVDGDDALIDYLIRNDMSFNKINGKTSERIPYAVFKLTSNATGESHIIVCDINGMFDSSQLENAKNTNMNDAALNADGTVDETKLDPTAGVWFSDPNNATNAINSIGAFPCGKYTFQELRTSANEGLRLVQFEIDIYQAAETVHIGTVDDNPLPAIQTVLVNKALDEHIAAPNEKCTFIDSVYYTGVLAGASYKVEGTLMDKETGNAVLDDAGKPILATKQFTPSESSGVAEVEFKFNGVELGGKMFVVFEELQTGGTVVAEHKDLEDEAQTIELIYSGKLRKIDASIEEPLAGVEIKIKDLTDRTERIVITSEEDEPFETIEFRNVRTGTIVLSKTDVISGDPVMGAEITVYDSEGKAIFVQKTDKYGRIYFFPDGKTGRFTFRETKAPEGYYLNEDIYAFEIDVNGGVTKITGTTKFTDAPYGVVVIKKTDTNGAPLAGAVLAIYDETGKKIGTGKTGETGRIYFVAPTFGKYYFVEEQAPQGYLKTDKQFYFEIDSDYKITGTTSITNEKSGIPTGDIDHSIFGILAVASVLCAGAAIFIYKKKQRTE